MAAAEETVFHQARAVGVGQVDPSGRMRASELALWLMDCADGHSRQLGCNIATLLPQGVTWMVTAFALELAGTARCGDTLALTTWPSGDGSSLLNYREFLVENDRGEVLVRATSTWALLDAGNRRMLRARDVPQVSRLVPRPERALAPAGRVRVPDGLTEGYRLVRRAGYTDLDMNGHVTTGRYFTWVEDALGDLLLSGNILTALTLDFAHEILPGQDVTVARLDGAGESFVTVEAGGQPCLRARAAWASGPI